MSWKCCTRVIKVCETLASLPEYLVGVITGINCSRACKVPNIFNVEETQLVLDVTEG